MSNAKTPKITTAFADTLTVVGDLESLAKAIRWHAILDTNRIAALRNKGVSRKRIATEMGVGVGTIYRVSLDGSKIREKVF
jgi:Helix-turn-helix domain of resolvase